MFTQILSFPHSHVVPNPYFLLSNPKRDVKQSLNCFFSMQQWWFTLKTHDMSNLNYFCYACTWCFSSYLKPDNMVVSLEQRKWWPFFNNPFNICILVVFDLRHEVLTKTSSLSRITLYIITREKPFIGEFSFYSLSKREYLWIVMQ